MRAARRLMLYGCAVFISRVKKETHYSHINAFKKYFLKQILNGKQSTVVLILF